MVYYTLNALRELSAVWHSRVLGLWWMRASAADDIIFRRWFIKLCRARPDFLVILMALPHSELEYVCHSLFARFTHRLEIFRDCHWSPQMKNFSSRICVWIFVIYFNNAWHFLLGNSSAEINASFNHHLKKNGVKGLILALCCVTGATPWHKFSSCKLWRFYQLAIPGI